MEIVCGANQVRTAIPCVAELVTPLQKLLGLQYRVCNSTKKTKHHNRPILGQGEDEDTSSKFLIRAIKNQVKLVANNPNKRLCSFTDATCTHWAGVLTEVAELDVTKSVATYQELEQESIDFVSGMFKGTYYRCHTPEQNYYAVIASAI